MMTRWGWCGCTAKTWQGACRTSAAPTEEMRESELLQTVRSVSDRAESKGKTPVS